MSEATASADRVWSALELREDLNPVQKLSQLANEVVVIRHEKTPETVDVGFIFTEVVTSAVTLAETKDAIQRAIEFAEGAFVRVDSERLKQGPSYIELGAWLGSQTVALLLMGLGAHFDFWEVVTPAALGITGGTAQEMMGQGFVMVAPKSELFE